MGFGETRRGELGEDSEERRQKKENACLLQTRLDLNVPMYIGMYKGW